ncbi:hypothetical protein [Tenacibaculum sp. 190524A05c]|uniref:Uncharacterized protein n=1 Tax=Tenacibaculum platacis TaxID=3137852 RepID=A0ABM9NR62_9FLAO
MKIINRIFMIPMVLMLLVGILDIGWVFIAALVAIPLGFLQILFCLKMLLNWVNYNKNVRVFLIVYFFLVIAHFITWRSIYNIDDQFQTEVLATILFCLPILLALSVTYILEKNLSHENIE